MPDNFFALTRDEQQPVRRLKLAREVQVLLSEAFALAAANLLNPDVEQIPFNGSYKPDQDEISYIEGFDMPDEIWAAIREPTSVEELRLGLDAPNIRAIFTGATDEAARVVVFQQFRKTQFLTPKGISIILDRGTFKRLEDPGLNISDEVHMIYSRERLFFRSFFVAQRILPLSDYYREATDHDLATFAAIPRLTFADPDSFERNADTWVRRRVALIQDSGIMERLSPAEIQKAAEAYRLPIQTKQQDGQEKLVLPSDKKGLKEILRFLDENYYTGPLSGRQYLANSRRPV